MGDLTTEHLYISMAYHSAPLHSILLGIIFTLLFRKNIITATGCICL